MTNIVESDSVIIIFDTEQGLAGPPGPVGPGNTTAFYILSQAASAFTNSSVLTAGGGIQIGTVGGITTISASGAGTGTVTSVGLVVPNDLFTTSAAVTTAGNITLSKVSQAQNLHYASPSGASGVPSFRALAVGDLASLFTAGSNISIVGGSTLTISATGLSSGSASGTVTSVGLSLPNIFTVSNSPITGAGTLTGTFVSQPQAQVFASPASGGAGTPAFRSLTYLDLPLTAGLNIAITPSGSSFVISSPGSGNVASVGLVAPVEFTVTGSPVTTSGNLTFTKANQNANQIYAGPASGAAAQPTFRSQVYLDLPLLSGPNITLTPSGNNYVIGSAASGSVTLVGLVLPNIFNVSGSPITSSGNLTATLANQASGAFLLGPISGGVATPAFRQAVAGDIFGAAFNLLVAGPNITLTPDNDAKTLTITAAAGSSGGGGSGTVTTVTKSGTQSPVYSLTITNPTTTPNLALTLLPAASATFLGGPTSGADANPTYRVIQFSDLPVGTYTVNYSTILNKLASSSGVGMLSQNGSVLAYRTLTGTAGRVTITNGDGTAGNPTFDVGSTVYTTSTSSLLNALSSATAGSTGLVTQVSDISFVDRTITGTTNRLTVSNGNGVSGNPTLDVGSNVFTNNTSPLLNALSSATAGSTGIVVQVSDISFVDRTITGTTNRVVVTNGSGVSGNPSLNVGSEVYTTSTSSTLNRFASATPSSGQIWIGNGTDLTLANISNGPNITVTNGAGSITIGSTASGSVTNFTAGNLSTWFTTTVATPTSAPGLTFNPTGAKGDIAYYSNVNTAANLGVGLTSQVIGVSNGLPAYVNTLQGFASATVSSTLTNASLSYQLMDASAGAVSLILPAASSCIGDIFYFKNNTVTGSNACTVQTNGTDTIEGSIVAKTAVKLQVIAVISDGVNTWRYLKPQIEAPQSGGTGSAAVPTDGQILIGSTAGQVYTPGLLTPGVGIQITNASNSVTIASYASASVIATNNLSPLFTASVINGTLTHTGSNAASGTVLAGPTTGAAGAYTFRNLASGDFGTNQITPSQIGNNVINMGILIDNGASAITAGEEGQFPINFPCTVTGWTILSYTGSGSCVFNVYKSTYASFPTMTSMIVGGTKPSITANYKGQNLAISDWNTVSVNTGDIIKFTLESISGFSQLSIALTATRTG